MKSAYKNKCWRHQIIFRFFVINAIMIMSPWAWAVHRLIVITYHQDLARVQMVENILTSRLHFPRKLIERQWVDSTVQNPPAPIKDSVAHINVADEIGEIRILYANQELIRESLSIFQEGFSE